MPKKETRACENKHIFTVDWFIYWEKWLERLEEKPPISAIASQKIWQVSTFYDIFVKYDLEKTNIYSYYFLNF